ncbi:Hypothetical_protein [Hexamita inflata]|uniref:Hypothetical_protein n=1 Tax=Hexamita inflata TaxID=28002 RepID=A0AA86RD36_9EUKA|nr:Hypothetical protein HINF_LOCUS45002 [Hexamita inflata]CAI9970833.1 Hypothetical protein HINF_LOCUS58478 [Hexamita inflata]
MSKMRQKSQNKNLMEQERIQQIEIKNNIAKNRMEFEQSTPVHQLQEMQNQLTIQLITAKDEYKLAQQKCQDELRAVNISNTHMINQKMDELIALQETSSKIPQQILVLTRNVQKLRQYYQMLFVGGLQIQEQQIQHLIQLQQKNHEFEAEIINNAKFQNTTPEEIIQIDSSDFASAINYHEKLQSKLQSINNRTDAAINSKMSIKTRISHLESTLAQLQDSFSTYKLFCASKQNEEEQIKELQNCILNQQTNIKAIENKLICEMLRSAPVVFGTKKMIQIGHK